MVSGHTGTWGNSDLAWKQIKKATGIETRVVPYDGGAPLIIAAVGGHVDVFAGVIATPLPHIKAGKLRLLTVLDDVRMKDFPDIPTAKEQGVDVVNLMWRGVHAPKGTPRPIVDKLAVAFKKMTEDKSVIEAVKRLGDDIYYLGPDEFAKFWRAEYEAHKEIGKMFKK